MEKKNVSVSIPAAVLAAAALAACGTLCALTVGGLLGLTALVAAAALLVMVVCALAGCFLPMAHELKEIREAEDSVAQLSESLAGADKFDSLKDSVFIGKCAMRQKWQRYARAAEKRTDGRITADISDYIDAEGTAAVAARARIFGMFPVLLAILGATGGLFSFVFPQTLTGAAVPALNTCAACAAAGLLTAVVFALCERIAQINVQSMVQSFLDCFADSVFSKSDTTAEMLAALKSISNLQTEQNKALETMTTNIAQSIDVPFKEMANDISRIVQISFDDRLEGVDKLVDNIVETLNSKLEDKFINLGSTIDEICSWQNRTSASLTGVVDGIAFAVKKLTLLNERYDSAFDTVDKFSDNISAVLKILQASSKEILNSVTSMDEKIILQNDKFAEFEKLHISTLESYRAAFAQSEQMASNMGAMTEAIGLVLDKTVKSSASIEQTMRDATTQLDELKRILEDTVTGSVNDTYEKFTSEFTELTKLMVGSIANMEKGSSAELNAAANRMEAVCAGIQDGMTKSMTEVYSDYTEKLREVTALLNKSLASSTSEQLNALRMITGKVTFELKDASDSLKMAYFSLGENVKASYDSTLKSFDKELASITSHLHDTLIQIRDTTEEIPFVLETAFKKLETEMMLYARYIENARGGE